MLNNWENVVYLKNTAKGMGVFAAKNFKKNDFIFSSKILSHQNEPTVYTIQIDNNKHAFIEAPGKLVNHSCYPSVYIHYDNGVIAFFCFRDLSKDEEILFDYETTEYKIIGFQDCKCNSDDCRRNILGFSERKKLLLSLYSANIFMSYLLT